MGLPSLPLPQSRSVKKGGGTRSTDGSTPCNRMMIFDHSLKALKEIVHYLT